MGRLSVMKITKMKELTTTWEAHCVPLPVIRATLAQGRCSVSTSLLARARKVYGQRLHASRMKDALRKNYLNFLMVILNVKNLQIGSKPACRMLRPELFVKLSVTILMKYQDHQQLLARQPTGKRMGPA